MNIQLFNVQLFNCSMFNCSMFDYLSINGIINSRID